MLFYAVLPTELSFKFTAGSELVDPNPPNANVCLEVVFPFDRKSSQTAKHSDLPNVCEGIGDRPLKKVGGEGIDSVVRCQVLVKFPDRFEETGNFGIPR